MATTIGVIATDATLTKAQCQKVSGLGHDGLARAISPVHTLLDGDTLFTLATGDRGSPDLPGLHALMVAAGECVTRAVGHAMLAAESVTNGAVDLRSYRDAFPSAFSPAHP
jgi:putative pantetheine hydrolase